MTKKTYLRRLKSALNGVSKEERERLLDYYRELIDDGVENGKSEDEVISRLESPEKVAENFKAEMADSPKPVPSKTDGKATGVIAALVGVVIAFFGAVLLFSLGVSAFSVTLAGAAVFFTSFAVLGTPAVGFAQMGTGLFVCGIGVLLFCLCSIVGKLYAYLLRACFSGKQPEKVRKKGVAITAIVGGGLAFMGFLIFFAGFAALGFRYEELTFSKDVIEKTETFTDEYDALRFETDNLWVDIVYSETEETRLVWGEIKGEERVFSYADGNLTLKSAYSGWNGAARLFKWGFWFSVLPSSLDRCTLYLPAGYAGDLTCKVENGRLGAKDMQFEKLTFSTHNGWISLENVTAEEINADSHNGKIDVISCHVDVLHATTHNGAVTIEMGEMREITAVSSNGAVMLEACRADIIQAKTTNGEVVVERVLAEELSLKTTNGTVSGTILGSAKEFNIDAQTKNGRCNLSNKFDVPDGKKLYVRTTNGAINLHFTN